MRRLLLLGLITLGVAPATWLRSPSPPPDLHSPLIIRPLKAGGTHIDQVEFVSGWQLSSRRDGFGGYSALLAVPDPARPGGDLFAVSDFGRFLRFPAPGGAGEVRFGRITGDGRARKAQLDSEAVTCDPQTGTLWFAYEHSNAIERRRPDLTGAVSVRPRAMAGFASNAGPEAFARLADGRFIVLSEGPRKWLGRHHAAYLFDRDPVQSEAGTAFTFVPPAGYRPVDMAPLPDGRVLILLRSVKWHVPPGFSGRLLVADPADIEPGGEWRGRTIMALDDRLPSDNYEGLAVAPQPDGRLILWLISDDNCSEVLQRTLLLKLRWDPRTSQAKEKAHG